MEILAKAKSLWMKFNVQGAILTSLSLQVFLVLLAPIRKRCSNRWFMLLVWLAYLGADLVANYASGLISRARIMGCAPDSEAVAYGDVWAFWASFLLVHLGGQDTITAFAIEDNELWHRHLLNLLFQVGSTGYLFYQSFPSSKLVVPTALMFIGGTIKYVERTIALRLASFSKLQASLLPPAVAGLNYAQRMEEYATSKQFVIRRTGRGCFQYPEEEVGKHLDDRTVIKEAFSYFTTFKGLLVDRIYSFRVRDYSSTYFSIRTAKDALRIVEAELNFFYDVLYTKAAIVRCPTGYLFRAISIGSVVSALAVFYVLNKHGFHKYDIQITYALLLGAIGLEFVALVRLICSDWTIAYIATSEEQGRSNQRQTRGHCRSVFIHMRSIFINFLLKFKSESSPCALHILSARWSKSMFQYNFFDSRLRKWPNWIDKLVGLISLGELFDDLMFRRVEKYSHELGKLIFEELGRRTSLVDETSAWRNEIFASPGKWALNHPKTERNCESLLPFVCDVDFGKSVIMWHIATELCYNSNESTNQHCKTSKVLSDYMLHLMIKQPGMMSAVAGISQIRFRDTCAEADRFFEGKKIFRTRKTSKTDACGILLSVPTEWNPTEVKGDESKSVLFDACILAKELERFQDEKWEIASEVWVELLAHAAIHCQPFTHAKQLSKGGELLTLVWLLMAQVGLSEQFQIIGGGISASAHGLTVAESAKDEAPACKFHRKSRGRNLA